MRPIRNTPSPPVADLAVPSVSRSGSVLKDEVARCLVIARKRREVFFTAKQIADALRQSWSHANRSLYGIAIDGEGNVWLGNFTENNILKYNPRTRQWQQFAPLGRQRGLADPAGKQAQTQLHLQRSKPVGDVGLGRVQLLCCAAETPRFSDRNKGFNGFQVELGQSVLFPPWIALVLF